ncbi:hypothetical protein SADUNF_Sadunf16G0086600 [Salix dunnii]|uniref:Uncharacterized protein n=1 Tax=Salix dunnii TaxID=1413687 RepID=A0A835JD68_9ROSI|nr:hypothetical protein SADUNF_Sadunf16G0086600 [Salix dunnii]
MHQVYLYGAHVYLNGAHMTSWKNDHGEELLFVSGKFGSHGSLEQHRFARNGFWSIDTDPPPFPINSKSFIDFILKPFEEDMEKWPRRVGLGTGRDLMLTSRIRNTIADGKPFTFTFAYHTYFSVLDIRIHVEQLNNLKMIQTLILDHVLDKYSGLEIWRIENFCPVPALKSSHGIFFMGDSYKPKRRTPVSHGGRSSVPNKSQRSRSMSFNPDRVRVRGRSLAFHALSGNFENAPPVVRKVYPTSVSPDSAKLTPKSAVVATLTTSFEQPPSYYASVCQRYVSLSFLKAIYR